MEGKGMWMFSLSLLVAGLVCIALALRGGNLGTAVSAGCQSSPGSACGVPYMPALISGDATSDLALWSTLPTGQPSTSGVWGRLINATSGSPQGAQVHLSESLGQQGVIGVYNPAVQRYLVLWQSGDAISGELLNNRMQAAGAGFTIPAHDYYVRPGELATDPSGGFLFSQAQNPRGLETRTRVFVTRISAAGRPLDTTSWPASNGSRQFQFAEVHSAYVPTARSYLVAWSLYGATGSTLADRIVGESPTPLGGVQTIASGNAAAGADFALGFQPQTATTRVIWLSRSAPVPPSLLSERLDSSGAPTGATQSIGQVSGIAAQQPADLGGLTLAVAGSEEIASWQGSGAVDTFTIPAVGSGSVDVTRTTLTGANGSYTHASATNAAARTLAILSTSNQGSLSQLYAQITPLPN